MRFRGEIVDEIKGYRRNKGATLEPRTFTVGVTGVIASGKSVFCKFLKEKFGFHWINADKLVHELYKAGNAGYLMIKKHFGKRFVRKKEVNRVLLRKFVFKNPEKLRTLNKIMHPLAEIAVNKKTVRIKALNKGKDNISIVIEAVYFESDVLGKFIDRLILIKALDDIVLKRLKKRRIPEDQAQKLIKFQRGILQGNGEAIENNETMKKFLKKAGKWAESLVQ